MKKTSAFGRPTPLPGESGYGANHTEVLERDTRAMEAQLQMLQVRLQCLQRVFGSFPAALF